MNNITMIPIEQLHHHPENPRLDLGDLTELAESIRVNGVMQNLTVVRGHMMSKEEWTAAARAEGADKTSAEASYDPAMAEVGDGYMVVIGNRRMEAAKLAGLAEVPCVISDMDHKTQVATMLMENMQRSDLTVFEQAQGFQMMMDLGFTAKEIGTKTGFSEKTVKDRIRFTKFNQKNFESAVANGATLMDMIEISKLESKTDQNEVMKAAGTNGFRRLLLEKLGEQKYKKESEILRRMAEEAGILPLPEHACTWRDYKYLDATFKVKDKEETTKKKLAKLGKQENMFYGLQRNWSTDEAIMTVYQKNTETKDAKEEEQARKEEDKARQRKVREVKKLWAEAFRLRTDFIRNYTVTNGTGMTTIGKLIARYALTQQNSWNFRLPENHHWNDKYIKETLGIKEDEYEDKRSIWQLAEDNGIPQIRVTIAWINGGGVFDADSSEYGLYYYYDGRYSEDANGQIKERYEFLKEIGYVMSDMEIQLMDGTHECYQKKGA